MNFRCSLFVTLLITFLTSVLALGASPKFCADQDREGFAGRGKKVSMIPTFKQIELKTADEPANPNQNAAVAFSPMTTLLFKTIDSFFFRSSDVLSPSFTSTPIAGEMHIDVFVSMSDADSKQFEAFLKENWTVELAPGPSAIPGMFRIQGDPALLQTVLDWQPAPLSSKARKDSMVPPQILFVDTAGERVSNILQRMDPDLRLEIRARNSSETLPFKLVTRSRQQQFREMRDAVRVTVGVATSSNNLPWTRDDSLNVREASILTFCSVQQLVRLLAFYPQVVRVEHQRI